MELLNGIFPTLGATQLPSGCCVGVRADATLDVRGFTPLIYASYVNASYVGAVGVMEALLVAQADPVAANDGFL